MKKAQIIGAGLVGSLWSLYLQKRGYQVDIYERRPDPRQAGYIGGRSINLACSDRGWRAMEEVGVADEVRKLAIPMRRRVMHAVDGSLSYQPYGLGDQAIYSISRGGLNKHLMTVAEATGDVKIHFDHSCEDFEPANGETTYTHNGEEVKTQFDVSFALDGAFSAVRQALDKRDLLTEHRVYPIDHSYKELTIPPAEGGGHRMEREALHIWPRGGFMLIALPNPSGDFTCTLFLHNVGEVSFESLDTLDKAREFFQREFPDAYALMPDFDAHWSENPTSPLNIVRSYPWQANGKVALWGDSSHAIVPFYGQGMIAGFEGCRVLNELLDQYHDDMGQALPAFSEIRKPDGDAISDLALRNFIEMRDLTGRPEFLLRKKIERRLAEHYPDRWQPLYSLVTFSHTPYHEALAIGELQDDLMAQFMAQPDIESRWDSDELALEILDAWDQVQAEHAASKP